MHALSSALGPLDHTKHIALPKALLKPELTATVGYARTANAFSLPFGRLTSAHEDAQSEDRMYSALPALPSMLSPSPLQSLAFWHNTCGPRKVIIYLEPRRSSALYLAIEEFFRASAELVGYTEAHQYHPHISMTGFIDLDDSNGASGHTVSRIACALHRRAKSLVGRGVVPCARTINTMHDYPHHGTHKVELVLDTPQVFREIIAEVQQEACPHIRPKRIGHISLAYYNKHVKTANMMSDEQAERLDALARSFLYNPDIFDPARNLWDIAFYELAYKSPVLDVPHKFNEIARWQL
ncbi:hypothetical protein DL89DRAFT_265923 [Linderina pennispora]|uniref:Uncharacterized protein n=1 Tax=Linderina pennispora TaxID=61395 RepID=A0A1Y1WFN6_9FUNG|nr:uncharacterized protein DL89DRAFT_265923 [Linderina pennispora]ORX72333.1 hypothetical protein DL89DRAFT_265923 [Linderina pennispora]